MLARALKLQHARVISVCGAGGKTSLIFSLAREFVAAGEKVLITTTTKLAQNECQGQFRIVQATGAGEILDLSGTLDDVIIAYSRENAAGEKLIGYPPDVIDTVFKAGVFDRILVEADGSRRKPLKAPNSREPVFPGSSDVVVIVTGLNGIGQTLCEENLFRADIWAGLSGLRIGDPITAVSVARMIADPNGLARGCPEGATRVAFFNRADHPETLCHARDIMRELADLTGSDPVHAVAGWVLPRPGIAL